MNKHISLARELGYEGQELRDYLKRQQDLESEERVAQREYEREKREADQKKKDREQKEKDRELEKMKIEAAQKDKEMEKLKIEAEVELKKIEAETTSHPWGPKEKSSNPRSPKLPYFDKNTDKMDSYLTMFKSYAISSKWDPSMWASYLSALL